MRAAPVDANINRDEDLDEFAPGAPEPGLSGPAVDIADGTPLPVTVIRSAKRTKTSAPSSSDASSNNGGPDVRRSISTSERSNSASSMTCPAPPASVGSTIRTSAGAPVPFRPARSG